MNPYIEVLENNISYRTFYVNISDEELVWHRDREDRVVTSLHETDWMIQLDNELPLHISDQIFIPKGVYHRLIKGTKDLKLKIVKL